MENSISFCRDKDGWHAADTECPGRCCLCSSDVCMSFLGKTESKTDACFFLKTLPSGTQRRIRYKSFHALSAACLERLKTAKRCWGHTAVAAQWRDHFWHLLWTLPKTACLEWEDRNGGEKTNWEKRHCKTTARIYTVWMVIYWNILRYWFLTFMSCKL